jgi:predicted Fe-Mo cluster-binding NifX family protein
MKIAVPVTIDNQIDGHFGHCDSYGVFTVSDNNEITGMTTVKSSDGCGCKSEDGSVLSTNGVTVLLAGGIGDGAVSKLNREGIEVIRGCSGNATEVVKLFISGLVEDTGNSCDHHGKHHDHDQAHAHSCGHSHEHGHEHTHNCGCN